MENMISSVWEYQIREFGSKIFEEKRERDSNLINRTMGRSIFLKAANNCFNMCVKNFKDGNLNSEETICLKNCQNTSVNYLFETRLI